MNDATILLVDDDHDFLEMNAHVLEARGYRVLRAGSPEEALEVMARERPRLVVTDVMMASLDAGFAFCRRLKADPAWQGVRVIVVSAVSSRLGFDFRPRTDEDLAQMHADAFFDKPVAPEALVAKVQELLGMEGAV